MMGQGGNQIYLQLEPDGGMDRWQGPAATAAYHQQELQYYASATYNFDKALISKNARSS